MARGRRLQGGNAGGAVRIGDTVRRQTGPWTPAVHRLLQHLHDRGFHGAARPLGVDDRGREVLTFLPGETIGNRRPWPAWVHSDAALVEVAGWLRRYHDAVADFTPTPDAIWREGGRWRQGLIIGHNDAAPYNAAWTDGRLTGFFDWDFAGPVTRDEDLAFTAFAWVPLHSRERVAQEGFTAFEDRPRRLRLFLDTYRWAGAIDDFVTIVQARITTAADGIARIAATGDLVYQRMLDTGIDIALREATIELNDFRTDQSTWRRLMCAQ